jgi:glyoxylase-like metal-dependent hydrolase (beta-lactamase superfamily II)
VTRIDLPAYGIVGIRAGNPGPFSLSGTNSWIVGRDPAWLVDPGPELAPHLDALDRELRDRGGVAGIALTHDHYDHAQAVPELRRRFPEAPVAAARGQVDTLLKDGDEFGPLRVYATPGHASDHLAFLTAGGRALLTGDAVLGEGSVFVMPEPGALAGYLRALGRLRALGAELILPGHGPVVVDVAAKLDQYVAHRLDRERRLVAALQTGKRSVQDLLDDAWSDVAEQLRPAAAVTLAAHLDKLADEGRLPADVERPTGWPPPLAAGSGGGDVRGG